MFSGEAKRPSAPNDLLGKTTGRWKRVVAEELDDLGKMAQPWFCGSHFPIMNRGLIHPELLSHLGLEQAEVEPAFAEVVAYRNKLSRIGLRWWLGRLPAQMAKRQRNGAPAAT